MSVWLGPTVGDTVLSKKYMCVRVLLQGHRDSEILVGILQLGQWGISHDWVTFYNGFWGTNSYEVRGPDGGQCCCIAVGRLLNSVKATRSVELSE